MMGRDLNRKIENESEMAFGLGHAGEISDATESYSHAVSECFINECVH